MYNKIYANLQMSELPHAGGNEYANLQNTIPNSTRVSRLAQVTVTCFAFSLVLLFAPDIVQLLIQVTYLRGKIRNMRAILLNVRAC